MLTDFLRVFPVLIPDAPRVCKRLPEPPDTEGVRRPLRGVLGTDRSPGGGPALVLWRLFRTGRAGSAVAGGPSDALADFGRPVAILEDVCFSVL